MRLETTTGRAAPASATVDRFLRLLLAGRLEAAAKHVSSDVVFLGRAGWHGEATPFREDALYQKGSLRQLPPAEVAAGASYVVSSAGFRFLLIRQTVSPEATAAFGYETIDDGSFISATAGPQPICG